MKLIHFLYQNRPSVGILCKGGILDVTSAVNSMEQLVSTGEQALPLLLELCEAGGELIPLDERIEYLPVLTHPEKILCVGLNYKAHSAEVQTDLPEYPLLFSKFNNALAGHRQDIPLPTQGTQFDYEAELVIVLGRRAKDVPVEQALSYVFGYTVGNDLSIRDLQFRSGQYLIGKSADKFAPTGPFLVTADEIDPTGLYISCRVNGELRQYSNTRDMVFSCAQIIHYASTLMTLEPGDMIFTGTPGGVIAGKPENERIWLKSGDLVECGIDGLGVLVNRMV